MTLFPKKLSQRYKKISRRLPKSRDWLFILIGVIIASIGCGIPVLVHRLQVPLEPQQDNVNIAWIAPTVKRYQPTIDVMAKRYNIDPDLIAIIMTLESGGDPKANSGEATGLMQITPLTAKDIASKYLKTPVATYNLYDPTTSIEFGAAYLSYLRNEFGDPIQGPNWTETVELVAAGYNGGPGAAQSLEDGHGLDDTQTVVYSRDAFNMWRERRNPTSPTYIRWQERGGSDLLKDAKAD